MSESVVADPAQRWIETIAVYEREFKKWEGRVEKILKRYKDEGRKDTSGARFNILWSNVQTAIPAVFSRLPKPDVSRRHRDNDPVGRVAALILERGLEFEIEHYPDYRAAMRNCVQDRFLGGRGVAWVRYEPHIKAIEGTPADGVQVTEDADEAQKVEEIEYECAPTDYVHWKDYGHTVARTWEEVTGVWRKVYMGREAMVERFGEDWGKKIPLDTKPPEKKDSSGSEGKYEALIYEIWDKSTGKALWLSKSLGKVVDEREDPLKLENFWPCPRPLFATLTTDSLVPVPDFTLYQDQADTLDVLADRIDGLIKALQVKGVYNAEFESLGRLFTEGSNNTLIPVKNWAAFAEKQGLKGAIDLVDLTPIFNALKAAYEAAEHQKQQVYEITGLADIIRGSTDPDETKGAQVLKSRFGSMRLRSMQEDVALFAAELLKIKAEIMARHFQAESLTQLAQVQAMTPEDQALVPQAIELLKSSPLRDFRIEVTSDSMIQLDEVQEKQDRMEFLQAVGGYMKDAVPAASENPQLAPLLLEVLKFVTATFKAGKQIEGVFDEVADKLKQAAANPQQKPDPEMAKIQATAQAESQRLSQEGQMKQAEMAMQDQQHQRQLAADQANEQFKANLAAQVEQAKQAAQAAQEQQQEQLEAARAQQEAQLKAEVEQHKATLEAQQQAAQLDFERWKVIEDNRAKIAVAEIAANTTLKAAEMSAAQAESENKKVKDEPKAQPITINNHIPAAGNKRIKKTQDGGFETEDK